MRIGVREEAGVRFMISIWILAWATAVAGRGVASHATQSPLLFAAALALTTVSALWFKAFGSTWEINEMPAIPATLRVLIDLGFVVVSIALPIAVFKLLRRARIPEP
jgi:hypothetical protein